MLAEIYMLRAEAERREIARGDAPPRSTRQLSQMGQLTFALGSGTSIRFCD